MAKQLVAKPQQARERQQRRAESSLLLSKRFQIKGYAGGRQLGAELQSSSRLDPRTTAHAMTSARALLIFCCRLLLRCQRSTPSRHK